MKTVLITSLGSNTSISVIKALRFNNDETIKIIGTDSNDATFCAGASMVNVFYQTPNVVAKPEEYENNLIEIINKEHVDCVIPIHDSEIDQCAKLKNKFFDLTFWAVNKPDIISLCSDKQKINDFLSNNSIHVPKQFSSLNNLTGSDLPLIVKPNKGVSSVGISIINNNDELQALKNKIDNTYLIQQFVKGKEYTIDCYSSYKTGDFIGACVRERIETKAGISTKGMVVDFPELTNICEKIHKMLNYKGASNIQFIVQNNVPYFIEINPRFSGAGILSYKANFNSPLFTLLESTNERIPSKNDINIKVGLKMTRYWQEVFS